MNISPVSAAPLGTLDSEVARDLQLLRDFIKARERHMHMLFGRTLRHSATRDELMRLIVLAFSTDRILGVSAYIRLCSGYATAPTVRAELSTMEDARLIILEPQNGRRSALVLPTRKLIDFYNRQLPRLREDFRHALLAMEPAEPASVS